MTQRMWIQLPPVTHMHKVKSDPKLKRWYREYNRALFKGVLPKRLTVRWVKPNKVYVGQFDPGGCYIKFSKRGGKKTFVYAPQAEITISADLQKIPRQVRMTLIHEMVHAYLILHHHDCDPDHGPRFQAVMKRLARQGKFASLW